MSNDFLYPVVSDPAVNFLDALAQNAATAMNKLYGVPPIFSRQFLIRAVSVLAKENYGPELNFFSTAAGNTTDPATNTAHRLAVKQLGDARFKYIHTAPKIKVSECYWAAEYALRRASGQWFCFPCDDTYLVPEFGARMLAKGVQDCLDLVFCEEVLVGPAAAGGSGYRVWIQQIG